MRQHALLISALVALTLLVFSRVGTCGFVDFDDTSYVVANPRVLEGLSLANLRWAFTTFHAANYHPLTWLSLMLDATLLGPGPMGFHLVNLGIHALNAALVYLLLARLTAGPWRSALVAAAFALHPLRVESVAWVSERKDVLSAALFLAAMLAYVSYARRPAGGRMAVVAAFMALSLLAKPMFVTLPVLLLLLDFWPLGRFDDAPGLRPSLARLTRLVLEKWPLLLLALAGAIITIVAQGSSGAVNTVDAGSTIFQWKNVPVSYARYIGKLFWFASLSPFYPRPNLGWPPLLILFTAWLCVALTLVALHLRRAAPWVTFGWLFFLLSLMPVIGIIGVGSQAIADRYTYTPLLGLTIALVWSIPVGWVATPPRRTAVAIVAAGVLAVLSIATWNQIGHWRDTESLWKQALRVDPENFMARNNMASLLITRGEPLAAIPHISRSLCSLSRYSEAYYNLGVAFRKLDNRRAAWRFFSLAASVNPALAQPYNNLGLIKADEGDYDRAIQLYRKSIELQSDYVAAHNNLGMALDQKGDAPAAEAAYHAAIRINPHYPLAHNNLGLLLARLGRDREAIEHFRIALAKDPSLSDAHNNLGALLEKQGDLPAAQQHYRRAVELKPDYGQAQLNLGQILARQGAIDLALEPLRHAARLLPKDPEAHFVLGLALRYAHQDAPAADAFRAVLRLRPDDAQAREHLQQLTGSPAATTTGPASP